MNTRFTGHRRAAIAAGLLTLVLAGCNDQTDAAPTPPAPPPTEVSVITIEPQRVEFTADLPGRTSAYRVAEVRPQVSGIILKRLFEEGTDVEAGQQLYQIDPARYQAAYNSARAALAKAVATQKSVKAKAERYADLVKVKAISRQDYDDALASLEQNAADIASARAALQSAKIDLDYTKVVAPISGRIGESLVTEGALVTASQAQALSTIQQIDPIYVDVTQSSSELVRLRRDIASGQVEGGAQQADVTLTIEGTELHYGETGKMQFSDITVDPTTGAVRLRALFPNSKGELLPGMFVRATVHQGVKDNAIVVPQQSVSRTGQGGAVVFVVGPDDVVAPRPIKTDRAIGDKWLVADGLKAGERVVVEGILKIRPGAKVKPVPFGATQSAGAAKSAPGAPASAAH